MFHAVLGSRFFLLPAILVVFVVHVPAAATDPTTVAAIGTALCHNATVTLGDPITEPTGVLTVAGGCKATLDLNGHTLTVNRVELGTGADLTISDSSTSADGELIAEGKVFNEAGIRTTGATLRIESGTVSAIGGVRGAGIGGGQDGSGGTVTVSGGTVTATGGLTGAGIGGGERGSGGTITVSGGTVTATGGMGGAGIGGGQGGSGGTITIAGGSVTATGKGDGAGIGGGAMGAGGTITVSGGTVTATGGDSFAGGAGIGGGGSGAGGTITISGGTVTATGGGFGGPGIGGGGDRGSGGTITVSGGTVTATSGFAPDWYGIGPGSGGTAGVVTIGPGLIRTDTEPVVGRHRTTLTPVPVPVPVPAAVPVLVLSCVPSVPVVGGLVTCTVTGGGAGVEILWRAAYNPVFAEAGVTLDADGAGTFSFVVPRAALGEQLMVELVEWTAPVSVGVAGGPVPGAVPAGDGPSSPAGRVALLLVLVGLTVAVVVRRVVGMTA